MKNLVIFSSYGHSCGYCGFNIEEDDFHYCDGFGHSVGYSTSSGLEVGRVDGSGCRNCQQGRYCEKFENLEKNLQNILDNDKRIKAG